MYGGLMHGTNLYTAVNSGVSQYGGTAEFILVYVQGGLDFEASGDGYRLEGGTLRAGKLNVTANGTFRQDGGVCTLANGLYLAGFQDSSTYFYAGFELQGGHLDVPSILVTNLGIFEQYGGTNAVAGDVAVYNSLLIYGGRFSSANMGVGPGGYLAQFSGTNAVSGVLSITGYFDFEGGMLSVNGIYLRGTLNIGNYGNVPTTLSNSGLINFGGTLSCSVSQNSLGQLGLSTNGTIDFAGTSTILRFADSHNLNWLRTRRLLSRTGMDQYPVAGRTKSILGTMRPAWTRQRFRRFAS